MTGRRRVVGWLPLLQFLLAVLFLVVAGRQAIAPPQQVGISIRLPAQLERSVSRRSKPVPHKPKPSVPPYMFPSGGRTIFPAYRLVSLYGTPDEPVLGVLGEQPAQAAIDRTKAVAALYQPLMTEHVLPTMEIITTVASAYPTDDNDYSREIDSNKLMLWIDAAERQGVYVVLDLQPGRSDFLKQAKQYQALLERPNVGLALDPEWRLTATQLPLEQIGTVSVDEINQVSTWLADIVRDKKLPQKLLLLHQFRPSMIMSREQLQTTRPELAYTLQMDGQGSQAAKLDTWNVIAAGLPANVQLGWKNFYDEDKPMLSPEATMQLTPKPWYISYQ